jgi:hypothetical protein
LREIGCGAKPVITHDPKWLLLSNFVKWLNEYWELVSAAAQALESGVLDELGERFPEFVAIVQVFGVYVEAIQSDFATMPYFFGRLRELLGRLEALENSAAAATVASCLRRRFSTTADGIACKVSYFLTDAGQRWTRARLGINNEFVVGDGAASPEEAAR